MSNGFRDNQESLLARIAQLESARDAGLDGLEKRLEGLSERGGTPAETRALADEESALRRRLDVVSAKLARSGGSPPPERAGKRAFRVSGLVAGALVALVAALLSMASATGSRNGGRKLCKGELDALTLERLAGRDCDPLLAVRAEDLPGGVHAVAPTDLVAVARRASHAGDEGLRGIDVPRVPPDGHVDLRSPAYFGVVSVHLAHHGGVFDFEGMHIGFEGDGDLVPDPRCSVEDVWRAAVRAGVTARADQGASITYKAVLPKGRAAWIFDFEGRTLLIDDATCAVSPDLHVAQ